MIRFYNAIANNDASDAIVIQAILDQLGTAIATVFKSLDDGKALLYMAESKREELTVIDLKLLQFEMEQSNYSQARRILEAAYAKPRNENFRDELQYFSAELERLETVQ